MWIFVILNQLIVYPIKGDKIIWAKCDEYGTKEDHEVMGGGGGCDNLKVLKMQKGILKSTSYRPQYNIILEKQ